MAEETTLGEDLYKLAEILFEVSLKEEIDE
jgi:hypothetical protein